jgi:uncharacterized protein
MRGLIMTSTNTANRSGSVVHNQNDYENEQTRVEFPSCGVVLRGVLLKPKGETAPLSAIVMAPGMSGVKEGSIMKYAEYFARGGFAVLAYDNINFGESDGEPRQEVDPLLQRRGYRDAITWASLRPDIDKTRIGIFGTSYSGGHALEVAAHDRRVKCVVSQIPAISGFKAFQRGVRADGRAAALKVQDDDRERRFLGKPPHEAACSAARQSFFTIYRRILPYGQRSTRLVHPAFGGERIHRPQLISSDASAGRSLAVRPK